MLDRHRPSRVRPSSPLVALLAAAVLGVTLPGARDAAAATAAGASTGGAAAEAAADVRLRALFDTVWQRELAADPLLANYLGDNRYNDRWPDMSVAGITARYRQDLETLEALRRIPRDTLSPTAQLDYDLFEREYQQRVASWPFKPHLYAINHRGGIQTLHEVTELLQFRTVRDYENWISRLEAVGTLVDQHIELLREAAREGRTQPRVVMQRIPAQLALQTVATAQDSPFHAPFTRFPEEIDAATRARLLAAGRSAIERVVLPAYARLARVFAEEYLPATRESVGIDGTPQGRDFYRERIAYHTTIGTLDADAIHDIGLGEVRRIREEMLAIKEKVGFRGTLQEFFVFLRTDPQFYYKSAQELFEGYLAVSKRIDPNLVRLFGKLPRTPYGVRAIPMSSAPDTTTAYYQGPAADGTRPGYYYVNLYRPEVRPKYEMEVLSVHEAVPGHHLQIALAMEQASMPDFRRNAGYTAYIEGWALYSESLGEELGLYQDPYSKFGQLTYDMWRAVRLVVDTGMHAKGWSRQQAIDFFLENAAKTEADIINEIDRYIAWPGQALAYKIGQLRILALRREAEALLGERFDVRAFHDAVLATGAVPLDIMERHVRDWMQGRLREQQP
jgi:prolyl oligopeptidase